MGERPFCRGRAVIRDSSCSGDYGSRNDTDRRARRSRGNQLPGSRRRQSGGIAHLPLPAGADVVKFDSGLGRIYAACSSGFIAVFQALDADHYRKLEDFAVQKMVHSLAVDTATYRVYAPEQQENGQPVARMIVYEAIEPAQQR